ncbi:MAG: hypothetical protein PUD59_03240 [bacterium]|nr:hypothetical protein [bacterium]
MAQTKKTTKGTEGKTQARRKASPANKPAEQKKTKQQNSAFVGKAVP